MYPIEVSYSMPFNLWLKNTRENIGMSQDLLGRKVGRSKATISLWERGENPQTGKPPKIDLDNIRKIVKALNEAGANVSEYEAFREAGIRIPEPPSGREVGTNEPSPDTEDELISSIHRLPFRVLRDDLTLKGTVPAAYPERRYEEDRGGLLERFGADFLLEVEGDSMEPDFKNGDVLVIRRIHTAPSIGKFVIALVYGDSVFKKLTAARLDEVTGEVIYTLAPTNGRYREIKASDVAFQGVVLAKVEML